MESRVAIRTSYPPAILDCMAFELCQSWYWKAFVRDAMQSATVGAAAATRSTVSQMLRSLTLLGPTVYRGNTNSLVLDAWAYLFGNGIDQVSL